MEDKLLKLLTKAIKNKDYELCRLLLDAIVDIQTGKRVIYYPEFSDPVITDDDYSTYEFIYENIIN